MRKYISLPIFTLRSILMWTYIHPSADDIGGTTKQKKKILRCIRRKCSIFWNKILKEKTDYSQVRILMPRCPCRDFWMAENKLHVCFLHKKPIRNSVLGKFGTHKINFLELQKHVPFVNKRLFLLLFWEFSNFICNCWHFIFKLINI